MNDKAEHSHSIDKTELYQLIECKDDVDLHVKSDEWEAFYRYHRPHGVLKGQIPYEVLKQKLLVMNNNKLWENNL